MSTLKHRLTRLSNFYLHLLTAFATRTVKRKYSSRFHLRLSSCRITALYVLKFYTRTS